MLKGLYQHIVLLLTYRHKGEGLETSLGASIFILALAIAAQLTRWQLIVGLEWNLHFIMTILMFILFIKLLGIRKTNAYFLISIGVDIISSLLGGLGSGNGSFITFIWEFSAMMIVWNKINNNQK